MALYHNRRKHAVAQLIEELGYKPEGRGVDSRWSHWNSQLSPSSRTMALCSTQPLTEISTSNLPEGKGRLERKADNITATFEPTVYTMWDPQHLTTL
jgi:hypothetical protein